MLEFMFRPLNEHADSGLGAIGQSFENAARAIELGNSTSIDHPHLPRSYLYRHSIELFLKSAILVIHRTLSLCEPGMKYSPLPRVQCGKKRKDLDKVHGLRDLFGELSRLCSAHRAALDSRMSTKWTDFPPEVVAWIDYIDTQDPMSWYFRYPDLKDVGANVPKSSFKPTPPEQLEQSFASDPKGLYFVVVDGDRAVKQAYQHDSNPLPEFVEALASASKFFSGVSLMFLIELGSPHTPN